MGNAIYGRSERLVGNKEYTVDELNNYLDDLLKGIEN